MSYRVLALILAILSAPISGAAQSGKACAANNTFRCAQAIEVGKRVEGFIDTGANRRKVFKISIETPGRYRIMIYKEGRYPQIVLGIYDDSQKSIYEQAFNDRERNFDYVFNAPGVYYMSLFNYPGSGPTLAFDFTIQPLPASRF